MDTKYCANCLPLVIRQTAQVVETLEQMIRDWELGFGTDDKSLYSLGIRRSLDIIKEHLEGDEHHV